MVSSKFNTRNVFTTLCLIALGVLALCGASIFKRGALVPVLITWGAFSLVFCIGYLASLKRITVLPDGLESQNLLLPFWKRYYRFAEFDYVLTDYSRTGEVLRLIKDGKRIVSIASYLYSNYDEIKEAVAVKDKSSFAARDNAEVVSEYAKLRLYGIAAGFLFLMLIGVGMCFADVMDGTPVQLGVVLFGAMETLFFGTCLFLHLFPYKKVSLWRGQVEVRRLLWPFKPWYYDVADFDGFYHVMQKSNGQLGSRDEYGLWLVKDGRLALGIEEPMYKNYEELKNAFQSGRCLGHLQFIGFQSLKYYFGKKI